MSSEQPDAPLSRRELRALREGAGGDGNRVSLRLADARSVQASSAATPPPLNDRGVEVETPVPPRVNDRADAAETPLPVVERSDGVSRREDETQLPKKRWNSRVALTIGVLALVTIVLAAVNLMTGPRLLDVRVDAQSATQASGSRVILTANQTVDEITPENVTITPATPFTLDVAGRDIGIRFTVPLDTETDYTLRVDGVKTPGASKASTFETQWRTPAAELLLLERQYGTQLDGLFPLTLGSEPEESVFSHPKILDFRQATNHVVVSVEENEQTRLIVMNPDGTERRDLPLPAAGWVQSLQVSDRGNLAGYLFTDAGIGQTSERGSVLVLESLDAAVPAEAEAETETETATAAETETPTQGPRIVTVAGAEVGMVQWQFIPDSRSLLFVTYAGEVMLLDAGAADAQSQPLGNARGILGIGRGEPIAYIDRNDGVFAVNLETGDERKLDFAENETLTQLVALPTGSLQWLVERTSIGDPLGSRIALALPGETPKTIVEVPLSDQVIQVCASPSGQYAAVVTAPDVVNNPTDITLLPLPAGLLTDIFDLRSDGTPLVASHVGFNPSWCAVAPQV